MQEIAQKGFFVKWETWKSRSMEVIEFAMMTRSYEGRGNVFPILLVMECILEPRENFALSPMHKGT